MKKDIEIKTVQDVCELVYEFVNYSKKPLPAPEDYSREVLVFVDPQNWSNIKEKWISYEIEKKTEKETEEDTWRDEYTTENSDIDMEDFGGWKVIEDNTLPPNSVNIYWKGDE